MPDTSQPELNTIATAGIFKASGKREHSDQNIQRRRLELVEMNRKILCERDLKLAMQSGSPTNTVRSNQRGSSTLALTTLIGGLSFAMIAVVVSFGTTITFPRVGIVIASPLAAAVAGAIFGAVCGALIGRWMKKTEVVDTASAGRDESNQSRVFRSLSTQTYGPRNRFEKEWTSSNLG